LKAYAIEQLANDPKVPWQVENEDGTFTDFTGTTLSETQSKFLAGMVLNMAKMNGYTKDLAKDKKRALKDAAQDGILAMPGFIENLKASSAV
jgi:hypothetical protein